MVITSCTLFGIRHPIVILHICIGHFTLSALTLRPVSLIGVHVFVACQVIQPTEIPIALLTFIRFLTVGVLFMARPGIGERKQSATDPARVALTILAVINRLMLLQVAKLHESGLAVRASVRLQVQVNGFVARQVGLARKGLVAEAALVRVLLVEMMASLMVQPAARLRERHETKATRMTFLYVLSCHVLSELCSEIKFLGAVRALK